MQQPTIYGKGKMQLAMTVRGQRLAMGCKSVLRPSTIEVTIALQWLAPTRTDGNNRAGKGLHNLQQPTIDLNRR
jgi:hypothetical protein